MFPTKILLASDGSEEAIRAARMATTLSEKLHSELHIVYVEPLLDPYAAPEYLTYHPEYRNEISEIAEREVREKLDEVRKKTEGMGKVVGAHARIGRPDAEIVHLAEEIGAGLVVLGSRGFGPLKRALMGSVSTSVVTHAHCSVLVVRGYSGEAGRGYLPGKILLAFDGSEEASEAARVATEIARATESELHVTYAMQRGRYVPHLGPEMWEGWEEGFERAKLHARSWVEGQAEQMRGEGTKAVDAHLTLGRPDAAIVWLADELEAGLVVVGSRGLGRVGRTLLGSVSHSVVRHAHCPVLVVRGVDHRSDAVARTEEERAQEV